MQHEDVRDLWDMFHPADDENIADEFDDTESVDPEVVPAIPTIDELPELVDYSTRGPNDFVLGGPLGEGRGAGRHFPSLARAYRWAVEKYGKARVQIPNQESEFRWALLIRAA